jgi:DNA-binding transcriptional regulator GbsR (MarR family)
MQMKRVFYKSFLDSNECRAVGLCLLMLLPASLSAQIKTGAQREAETLKPFEAKWENDPKIKEIIYAPYDSSYFHIRRYPALNAYKKYIGQKLYFTRDAFRSPVFYADKVELDTTNAYYGESRYRGEKYIDKSMYCYTDFVYQKYANAEIYISKASYSYNDKPDKLKGRYYTIIDILSVNSEKYRQHHRVTGIHNYSEVWEERISGTDARGNHQTRIEKKEQQFGEEVTVILNDDYDTKYYCPVIHIVGKSEYEYGYKLDGYDKEEYLIDLYDQKTYKTDTAHSKIKDHIPYFVLREEESGDTVYTVISGDRTKYFLLVGSFVKIQQEFFEKRIFELKNFPDYRTIGETSSNGVSHDNIIEKVWKCVDVVLEEEKEGVVLVLQNIKNQNEERKISYAKVIDYCGPRGFFVYNSTYFSYADATGYFGSRRGFFVNESTFDRLMDNAYADKTKRDNAYQESKARALQREKEEKKEEEEKWQKIREKAEQEAKQQELKRKQELTAKYGATTAQKIIDIKLEIGMSKAVCKEMLSFHNVVDRTATTEIWKIHGGYLYFEGDKLVRISNY